MLMLDLYATRFPRNRYGGPRTQPRTRRSVVRDCGKHCGSRKTHARAGIRRILSFMHERRLDQYINKRTKQINNRDTSKFRSQKHCVSDSVLIKSKVDL